MKNKFYFLCLGALGVAVNMEASAANRGAASTVTAPTRATVEPPVTSVSANTQAHTQLQFGVVNIFCCL